ncbi:hypothetical protein GCM10010112_05030 [Actinoplanes lobatus]|uniref:Uncharacterized protein n=1 Tax=Actinoplanes lobatus TaxID=113568 RepID=A0A7W7HAN8_9ACTN|nr:hypothetical protein [Actinoplanes lobatus]MBB4746922.1 hypothetical protein [Actinoplanes lobatus]GGN54880.1 hypothetical protein GCM10010112_05030 [Actinoplanes lobatus]GIE41745.1 hypothetical protein Alo02nite_46430 [Actinoplanes lobatus]
MTTLEVRYRRLLRVYPSGHRAAYEEEMVGVLMSGAEPGRRFPSPADALDLLRAGLTARLGHSFHTQRGTGWRPAAAVTGLFVALVLAGGAVSRLAAGLMLWGRGDPMRALGVDGLMLADPAARTTIWLLVVTAAVLGLRRATVALAAAGVLVQAGAMLLWTAIGPVFAMFLLWQFGLAIVVTGLFAFSDRPVRAVLSGRGLALVAAGTVVAAATEALARSRAQERPWFDPRLFELFWDLAYYGLPALALAAAAWTAGRRVRGRIAVLSAVVLMISFVLQAVDQVVTEWRYSGPSVGGVLSAVVLFLLPFLVLGGGVLLLGLRERLAGRGHGHVRAHE